MILYLDKLDRKETPAWLEGAADLHCRQSTDGRFWGVGDAFFVGPQPTAKWADCGDGLSACVINPLDCGPLSRSLSWCKTGVTPDLYGRVWRYPVALSYGGERAFHVSYGPDFLPLLTDQQKHCEDIARAARGALMAATLDGQPLAMSLACAWTAELLSITNHVTPKILAALGLLDDALIGGVLYGAAGLNPDV